MDGVKIPNGFYYVGGTKESGLVISDSYKDENKYKGETIVGTDLQGNQFVWIPVNNLSDYKRTAYSTNITAGTTDSATSSAQIQYSSTDSSYFIEAMPEDEKTSVETYHGFYLGRYEAGDKESTSSQIMRTDESQTINTVTLKKGQTPYNYVSKTQAQILAEGMDTKQGYNVTTKLCSSYAWDSAISFIQKTNSNYGNNSTLGNYSNTEFDYIALNSTSITHKNISSSTLVPTGQTTSVCNIFDIGGNCSEWTTETSSASNMICTSRGGSYNDSCSAVPAGYRQYSADSRYNNISFRIALFM